MEYACNMNMQTYRYAEIEEIIFIFCTVCFVPTERVFTSIQPKNSTLCGLVNPLVALRTKSSSLMCRRVFYVVK